MFEVPADLDAEHRSVLAALPIPLAPAGVRCLRAIGAKDHAYAQAHRHSGLNKPRRGAGSRAVRLLRQAVIAESRSADLLAEAR
jgi:hypothetical protein